MSLHILRLPWKKTTPNSSWKLSGISPVLKASYFGFNNGKIDLDSDYIWEAADTEIEQFGALNFDASKMNRNDDRILTDIPLEFALLSYYSQPVLNIRPVQADAVLPRNDEILSQSKQRYI
jgi:hypothetical protein